MGRGGLRIARGMRKKLGKQQCGSCNRLSPCQKESKLGDKPKRARLRRAVAHSCEYRRPRRRAKSIIGDIAACGKSRLSTWWRAGEVAARALPMTRAAAGAPTIIEEYEYICSTFMTATMKAFLGLWELTMFGRRRRSSPRRRFDGAW